MNGSRIDRRGLLWCLTGAALVSCRTPGTKPGITELESELARLEGAGRLGLAVLDTANGVIRGRRIDERFAMCSTFKMVLAAMVLDRAAKGGPALESRLRVGPSDLLAHAPITGDAVAAAAARGEPDAEMTLNDLAEAAQTTSDNAAANRLLRDLGGPASFNEFCRALGDGVTRLDRYEPEMNDVRPGDERDTTTPRAMAQLVARIFGGAIAPAARHKLRQWMIATETGSERVRRGLPADWIAGDKTGTGGGDGITAKCNDVVWVEPPHRAPLVIAAYYDSGVVADWPSDADQGVLAAVGDCVAQRY